MANEIDQELEAKILDAHERDDKSALVDLYSQAADLAQDVDAESFFLTYAHVYAMELNHASRDDLISRLQNLGRE